MEVLSLRTLFMLTGYGAIASTAIHETKSSQEVAELKKLFFDELHEIENRYEDKLEALRGEMVLNNIMLRKTVDELNTKLESERREKSDAMQQLEKKISEKETKLMVEIKDLKNQLITDHNDRNREVDRLKAVILESMPAPKTDLNTPKEKDGIVSKGSLTKGSNWVEDAAKRGTKRDMHELNKEATGIGNSIISFNRLPYDTELTFFDILL